MWDCPDSQEVGLEAATLERVRNSSLVEWSRADNVSGLKLVTEAAAVRERWVGERRGGLEASPQGGVERPRVRMPV